MQHDMLHVLTKAILRRIFFDEIVLFGKKIMITVNTYKFWQLLAVSGFNIQVMSRRDSPGIPSLSCHQEDLGPSKEFLSNEQKHRGLIPL